MSKLFDPKDVSIFWENHAKNRIKKGEVGLANLETDPNLAQLKINLERNQLKKYFQDIFEKNNKILFDIGSGYGEWSFFFQNNFKKIYAFENSPTMNFQMTEAIKKNSIKNIEVLKADVGEVRFLTNFDVALMSGILIYLDDDRLNHLLKELKRVSKNGSVIVVRDGTGINNEFIIDGDYSEALNSTYYALYRTRERYIEIFLKYGFKLLKDEDMFEEKSPLNKWKETRLRIYKFIYQE